MRVAVLGAGAIGAYVGAALCRADVDVHLIARKQNLDAMRKDGVRVISSRGDWTAHPPATDDPAEVGPVDYVFLGLKANSYGMAGPMLEPLLHEKTAVIAAQNGIPWWYFHGLDGELGGRRIEAVDPGGAVTEVMPPERAIGCVVYAATELQAPGRRAPSRGHPLLDRRARPHRLRPLPRVQRGDDRGRPEVPGRGRPARRDLGQADGQRRLQPDQRADTGDDGGHLPLSSPPRTSWRG